MFVSDGKLFSLSLILRSYIEPGYYEDGVFGIRIENIVLIKAIDTKVWVRFFIL